METETGEPTVYDRGFREGMMTGLAEAATDLLPPRRWRRLLCRGRGHVGPDWTAYRIGRKRCVRCRQVVPT